MCTPSPCRSMERRDYQGLILLLTLPLWSIIRNDNHYLDQNDSRGKATVSIKVAYSEIDRFPQITEKI